MKKCEKLEILQKKWRIENESLNKTNKGIITSEAKKSTTKILKDPVWVTDEVPKEKEPNCLLAIAIYDSNDLPKSSFSIGETMKILVAYRAKAKMKTEISIGLKNNLVK